MLKLAKEIPSDYILNPEKSYFSIVVPEEGTNLVVNPEVYDLFGYIFTGEHDLVPDAHYGLNSIRVNLDTEEEASYAVAMTLNPNTSYTFSLSIRGVNEVELRIYASGVVHASKIYKTTDFWTRYSVTVHVGSTPIINPKFAVITKNKELTYLSAWQVEEKPYATTFISGNLSGFNPLEKPIPYFWTGVPHRSASTRTKFTNDGGKVVNLIDIGIHVTGYEGFGLPDFQHNVTTLVNRQGSLYRSTTVESRDISIMGVLYSRDFNKFFEQRSLLMKGASPFNSAKQQPMKLLFQLFDCSEPKSEQLEMAVLYTGGLEGNYHSAYGETLSIDFTLFDPFIYRSGNKSELLCLQQAITNSGLIFRDKNGVWGTTPDVINIPKTIEVGADNNLYIGMDTSFDPNGVIVSRFDGLTITNIGFGGEELDAVYVIEQGSDNKLYVGGSFNHMNDIHTVSVGKALNLARYNLRNGLWEMFGNVFQTNPALFCAVYDIKQLRDGRIAIVGSFDRADTPTTTSVVCRNVIIYNPNTLSMQTLDGATLTGIGTPNQQVLTVQEDKSGHLWVGGQFTETIGPTTLRNVAKFTPNGDGTYKHFQIFSAYIDSLERRIHRTTMIPLGQDKVNDIEISASGGVYACGRFDASKFTNDVEAILPAGEYVATNPFFVARYNDSLGWEQVGLVATIAPPATSDTQTEVFDLEYDPQSGQMYFSGYFNFVGAPKYLPVNNPSTGFTTITSRNPAEHLVEDYDANTVGLGKTDGNTMFPEPFFTLTLPSVPFGPEAIKIGGFYPAFSYTSTFDLPPSFLTGLSDAGYVNTFYTNMRNRPMTLICTTEVDIPASDIVFPVLTIIGPGELISLRNYDGGLAPVVFNKLLLDGEILVIDWTGAIPTISSNLFGNQNNIILPGSSLSTFKLYKGLNHVSLFMDSTTITSVTKAYLTWREAFIEIDSAVAA